MVLVGLVDDLVGGGGWVEVGVAFVGLFFIVAECFDFWVGS